MTTAQAEKLKKLEAAYERAYKHGGEVALNNAQIALERFEAALERSEKLKAAGLISRNPRRRRNGGSYTVKGVPIGVPRHSFDPRKGDVFYVSGKRVTVKSTSGDMVSVSPSVQGMYALGMGNLYQIARVPEDSRFAPYEYRARVKGNTRRRVNAASSTGKMIPAKVMVGKGGKVRVFVNPKHLTGLHQSRNPMTLIKARIKSKLRDGVPGDTTHLLTAPIIDSKGVILFRRGTAFIPLSGGLHGDRAYAAIGIGGQRREFEWDRK